MKSRERSQPQLNANMSVGVERPPATDR